MSKKIMLLALAAISAAVFALPATASAFISLHLKSAPAGAQAIDDLTPGNPTLTTAGSTIECETFSGSATFDDTGGTTGKMNLKFSGNCKELTFNSSCHSTGAPNGTIETTTLPFHLVTLTNQKPGVLVTPSTDGSFAHVECFGTLVKFTVGGNGILGTITSPGCGGKGTSATIDFNATAAGVQEHTTVEGTPGTVYRLTKEGENAAQDAIGKLTLSNEPTLECT
jgi:hypothetical protein